MSRTGITPDGKKRQVGLEQAVKTWPTPTAGDAGASGSRNTNASKAHFGVSLTDAVRGDQGRGRMWPTPQAHDSKRGHAETVGRFGTKHGGRNLTDEVQMFPTPTARDWRSDKGQQTDEERYGKKGKPLRRVIGGQLNPTWVEWLMGFPPEWTALKPSAMQSFRKCGSDRQVDRRRMEIAIRFPDPGRPRRKIHASVIALRVQGLSSRRIAKRLGLPTVHRAGAAFQKRSKI